MTRAFASGACVEIFETLDSTSLEAKRRAAAGAVGPQWIIALRQTSGYGRRGSEWVQQEGDIAATFLFRPEAPTEILPQLSMVAALGLADAIERFAPKSGLALKWPNDILAGGSKLAGILLELVGAPPSLIALGVGVNVVSAPEGLAYPTARLIDLIKEAPPDPRRFVEVLDATFSAWRRRWEREGFAPVRSAWLDRVSDHGRRIRVQLTGAIAEGVFAGLDPQGALILDCDGERRVIAAGAILPPGQPG